MKFLKIITEKEVPPFLANAKSLDGMPLPANFDPMDIMFDYDEIIVTENGMVVERFFTDNKKD